MKEFKKGDAVIAQNFCYFDKGEIADVVMSTGSRKEPIYNVGINWYFADELMMWYDGTIKNIIGADIDYYPEKKVKFIHNGIKYTIQAIKYNSTLEWCYLKVDKAEGTDKINDAERGIGFYQLNKRQIERIYRELFLNN